MSTRGFNRGHYYGKRNWRGGYKARNNFRERGFRARQPAGQPRSRTPSPELDDPDSIIVDAEDTSVPRRQERPIVRNLNKIITSPYAGWKLYFPEDEYKTSTAVVRQVKAVEDFILSHANLFNEEDIEERRSCIFDLKAFFADDEFMGKWLSFKNDLSSEPLCVLNCLGLAIHQILWKSMKEQSCAPEAEFSPSIDIPMIRARVINYDTLTQFKNLKTNYYGKLVLVGGTVIRVGNVKLQCSWLAFKCGGCNTIQCVKQPDGEFTQPTRCLNTECRCRTFTSLPLSSYTQTFDWQTIKLQEMVPDDQRDGGRVPRTIECELTEDLVNSCSPGDIVTITGLVKIHSAHENSKKNKGLSMFTLYLEAVSVINNKNMDCARGSSKDNDMAIQFTQKDYDAIQEIHSEPNLFKLLVHSLCSTIYGHEMVKAGMLLGLFGGSQEDGIESRGQAHVLVVGDPGLGKSQMLQACSFVAPRGVFVCGNTTTTSGMTVTLCRESGGDFSLEAGALVLADQGCCCIDEFDKMSCQHQALLEVMEQQTVSVAKAGIICMLPARTTVIAAANPVGGHYNKGKTVSENLRMGQALLSRFDLVFILLDKPNEHLDSMLSAHVTKMHLRAGLDKERNKVSVEEFVSNSSPGDRADTLSDRLKKRSNEDLDLIPSQLLRKYIAYAHKYVPTIVLSKDARNALQQFYLQMRENHHTLDSTPVTTRQLLSLIRLTQARAKLELREEATLNDALDVIDIVRWSLIDTLSDEYGTLDFNRSQHGSGMSSKNQVKRFLTFLHRKAERLSRSLFTVIEMKEVAKSAAVDIKNFSTFISTLNNQGYLLKKGKDKYQILSAD